MATALDLIVEAHPVHWRGGEEGRGGKGRERHTQGDRTMGECSWTHARLGGIHHGCSRRSSPMIGIPVVARRLLL